MRSRSRDGRAESLVGRMAVRNRSRDGRDGGAHWHHEVAAIQPARASGFATMPPPPLLPELGQSWFRMLPGQAAVAPQRQRACMLFRQGEASAPCAPWRPRGAGIARCPPVTRTRRCGHESLVESRRTGSRVQSTLHLSLVMCAHDPSKMEKQIPKGSSIFFFIVSVKNTKENFFSNEVHQGPLSVDLDDSRRRMILWLISAMPFWSLELAFLLLCICPHNGCARL